MLVVTGDISFNGEYRSHLFAAQTLRLILDAGIPVSVIPGNHDICTWIATDYSNPEVRGATTIEANNFASIYADFMPGIHAPEGCGFSYLVPVSSDCSLLMLDTCWYDPWEGQQAGGYVRDTLPEWIETVLTDAEAAGVQVISATHQSIFPQSDFRSGMYMIADGEKIASLMVAHGMKLNLSGHVHAQHILNTDGLWDAAVGAFSLSPHLYAMVTVKDDGSITYEARPACEEHFPQGFTDYSRSRFHLSVETRLQLPDGLAAEEQAAALELRYRLNYAYFSGTLVDEIVGIEDDPAWQMMLEKDKEGTFIANLQRLINETPDDMRHLFIP